MNDRYELRFSGEGGQGVILGGAILAEAVILNQGQFAVQSPSYGSRVRGGPTKVDVIVSAAPILFPRASRIDFFLALAQMAYDKFRTGLAPEAVVLVDSDLVSNATPEKNGSRLIQLPMVEIAKSELGNEVLSNVVALGAMTAITGVVSTDALWQSIEARVPGKWLSANRKAFEMGMALVELGGGE